MSEIPDSIYSELPLVGPYDVALGYALITMAEPHPGHERAYNRWYEDDHYFSGAMFEPYLFAGRRWVATRDLQLMRYPTDTPIADPFTLGCYLGTYWVAAGRVDHTERFAQAANKRLLGEGRKFDHRTLVFSDFQDYVGAVYRDDEARRDLFALIDPYPGLVLEVMDAETPEAREDLERWLLDDYLPGLVQAKDSPVEQALVFRTTPPRAHHRPNPKDISNGGRRLTLLWFLSEDPRQAWSPLFSDEGVRLAGSGRARASLVAPFIPARMGTDAYVDQLR